MTEEPKPPNDFKLIAIVVLFLTCTVLTVKYLKDTKPSKSALKMTVRAKKQDSVKTELDSVLKILTPKLKKREGWSADFYYLSGRWYIGYGHAILHDEFLPEKITLHQGDSILKSDITEAYYEIKRIYKQKLIKNIFNIFISGKP